MAVQHATLCSESCNGIQHLLTRCPTDISSSTHPGWFVAATMPCNKSPSCNSSVAAVSNGNLANVAPGNLFARWELDRVNETGIFESHTAVSSSVPGESMQSMHSASIGCGVGCLGTQPLAPVCRCASANRFPDALAPFLNRHWK